MNKWIGRPDKKAAHEAQAAAQIAAQQEKTLQLIGKIEKSVRKSFLKNFKLRSQTNSKLLVSFRSYYFHNKQPLSVCYVHSISHAHSYVKYLTLLQNTYKFARVHTK